MEIRVNSARGPDPYNRSWSLSFLHKIYSQSFLLHCFFPSQEPPDTFLEWFSDDNKVISIKVLSGDPRAELPWQGFKHNDEQQWAEYRALVKIDLHFKLFTVPPIWTWLRALAYIPAPVAQSTPQHQVFLASTRWPSEALDQMPFLGLQKPCRVSCWQLDTFPAAAWQQRLRLLCFCLGGSQTGNHWLTPTVWWGHPQSSPGFSSPALSARDRGSCLFPMRPLSLVEADNETLLPVRGYLAITNDCSCKVTDHGGAHVTGCSYHLHHYVWWAWCFARLHRRDSLLNISMVIGMGGPSTGLGPSHSTLRSLW